jgi:hypothetical protein
MHFHIYFVKNSGLKYIEVLVMVRWASLKPYYLL